MQMIIGKKMAKKIFLLIFAILYIFFYFYANDLKNDKLFKYVMTKSPYDEGIIFTYIKYGYLDEVIPLIEKVEDNYNLLLYVFESSIALDEERLSRLKTLISNYKDDYYKNYLLLEIGKAYTKIGLLKEASEVFIEVYEKYNSETDTYERLFNFVQDAGLCDSLIQSGFNKEAETILLEAEKIADSFNDVYKFVSSYAPIIQRYLELNKKNKIIGIINKICSVDFSKNPIESIIPQIIFELGEVLLKIEEFDRAKTVFLLAFKTSELISDKNNLPYLYSDHFLNKNKGALLITTIGAINEIIDITKRIAISINKNKKIDSSKYKLNLFNQSIIKVLVQVNRFKEAQSIAEIIDSYWGSSEYTYYYYYCLGERYSESYGYLSASFSVLEKIKSNVLKIELLIKLARRFNKSTDLYKFNETMAMASKLLSDNQNDSYVIGKANDIADVWLETQSPEKALEIIAFNPDENDRSWYIYKIAQFYAINYNLEFANNLTQKTNNPTVKALILSKMAARLMCNGKYDDAIILFKKAYDILIKNNSTSFLPCLFHDYLNAKIYKRVIKIEIMNLFPEM